MTELEIAGVGIWSPMFSDWKAFLHGINHGEWQSDIRLQPELIQPRERRRAPQSVKMAVEVLDQACTMASIDPADAAVVFSSAMGDMQITDYMCRILTSTPRLVSPTKFHNSVHNATTGYWSIASHSHAPTNAVSAYAYTAPMAFLEAACQAAEDDTPVLLVTQEMAAPDALRVACPSNAAFSLGLALTLPGVCKSPMASLQFEVLPKSIDPPIFSGDLKQAFENNYGAALLPMIATIADSDFTAASEPVRFELPLAAASCLSIVLSAPQPHVTTNG